MLTPCFNHVSEKVMVELTSESDSLNAPSNATDHAQEAVYPCGANAWAQFTGASRQPFRHANVLEGMMRYIEAASPASSAQRHVVAFVNGLSGERETSEVVYRCLLAELGQRRVTLLSSELFANPHEVRRQLKEQAVVYHPECVMPTQPSHLTDRFAFAGRGDGTNRTNPSYRGTVVVSGGDGTISFMMSQIEWVGRELVEEFAAAMDPVDTEDDYQAKEKNTQTHETNTQVQTHVNANRSIREPHEADRKKIRARDFFDLPAIAPIPLGTGNDFSTCMGFGNGLVLGDLGYCSGLCDTDVVPLLEAAIEARCVAFDRWYADLIPLSVLQEFLKQPHGSADGTERKSHPTPEDSLPEDCPATEAHDGVRALRGLDWARLLANPRCVSYSVMNYLGLGYDSYVAFQFDRFRKRHPRFCRTRFRNKLVYCAIGLKAGRQCRWLRRLIPAVVIAESLSSTTATTPVQQGGRGEIRPVAANINNTQDALGPSPGARFVALQLPKRAKALVMSNINSYSGGTHPWREDSGPLYYRPIGRDGKAMKSPPHRPLARPVGISDGEFELQTLGGTLDYSTLSLGLDSATKIAQSHEVFIFFRFTPTELEEPTSPPALPDFSTHGSPPPRLWRGGGVWVQIDGEPMQQLCEPTLIRIRRKPEGSIWVRCRDLGLLTVSGVPSNSAPTK